MRLFEWGQQMHKNSKNLQIVYNKQDQQQQNFDAIGHFVV